MANDGFTQKQLEQLGLVKSMLKLNQSKKI